MTPMITGSDVRGKTYANMETHSKKSVLGQDDFLKILITQLRNQDPMQPMQDRDFIAQMATFSSLEQMTNMSKAMQEMRGMMLGQATSYIGKEVLYEVNMFDYETKQFIGKEAFTGSIMGIENEKDKTILVTSLGHRITFDALLSIAAETRNPITDNAHLIGKKVSYYGDSAEGGAQEQSGVVTAVSHLAGNVVLIIDNNDKIGLKDVLKVENA